VSVIVEPDSSSCATLPLLVVAAVVGYVEFEAIVEELAADAASRSVKNIVLRQPPLTRNRA